MPPTTTSAGIDLLNEIACPNCWKKFPPEAALAIAGHGDLLGDPRLEDPAEARRFVPTRFTPECAALDEKDTPSYELACPHCHLLVPRVIFERRETIFLSIFGDVSSGKSYFLSAMARQMETVMPQRFGIGVTEPHPASNTVIRNYKNQLFNTPDPDALVFIPSTSPSGRIHYQGVKDPGEVRQYPRPMFFQAAPTGRHPNATKPLRHTRTICLYDNSGEHFFPNYAKPNKPETEHLARSSAMIFVFDPTREPAFVERCAAGSQDPQFEMAAKNNIEPQEVILATADQNVKKWMGRMIAEPLDKPLVMILAKFDAWKHFVAGDLPPYATGPHGDSTTLHAFNADEVERISGRMRELLLKMCPSIVATAERFSRRVCYIPTSATGCSPIIAGRDAERGKIILKFRRGSIRPIWAEVPLLWILDQLTTGLVPITHAKDPAS